MKVGKPTSKRVPVRLRHKIQKASASKQRKERKAAKKNPQWKSRMKKDPGIPNLFPYKDRILAEIEDGRRKKEEEALKRREEAKARRGGVVEGKKGDEKEVVMEDEELGEGDEEESDDDGEMEVEFNANPMAALLASAQARAQAYTTNDESSPDDVDEEEAGGVDLTTITSTKSKRPLKSTSTSTVPSEPTRKPLPPAAIADPIATVTKLLLRLQRTPNESGTQQLLDAYDIAPLPPATDGIDKTSRFLVDVARKRGRLGRGGVPNLHAAAYTVLGDLQEGRVRLAALEGGPVEETKTTTTVVAKGAGKGKGVVERSEVQIVRTMAEPFRIEGLFGDD
jgi:nuclear GTP-binding protein